MELFKATVNRNRKTNPIFLLPKGGSEKVAAKITTRWESFAHIIIFKYG